MERPAPPYRADHVGSFVRPPELVAARRDYLDGRLPAAELKRIEDAAIRAIVAVQEKVGLRSITDGEYRRTAYLREFLNSIGIVLHSGQSVDLFDQDDSGRKVPASQAEVSRKIAWSGSVNVAPFKFLQSITTQTPKVTIPAPTQAHLFAGRDGVSRTVYPDLDAFWDDIAAAYRAELAALGAAGCRFVQIDETALPKFADPAIQALVAARGHDWRALAQRYVDVLNRILAGAPAGMAIAIHHCRGNNGPRWQAQGGYDLVAEMIFAQLQAPAYFLEYDTPRAGDFTPLRLMPKDKIAVLGLVSTKRRELETADALKRRIEEASRYHDLDRLCLAPQCGFASGFASAPLAYDEQARKLERLVEVARDVWDA